MNTFEIVAGVASVLGCIISIGAFYQARSASIAAKEARNATIGRTLADELESACGKADDLYIFLAQEQFLQAAHLAHQLTSALSEVRIRRGSLLTMDRRNDLLSIRTQIQIIEEQIFSLHGQSATGKQKERLLHFCRESATKLRENLGTIKGQMDRGGNP